MELSKNKKKLIVTKSELESKISSKKDLHYILRQGCKQLLFIKIGQYYIPNMNQWPIVYLQDVLSGKKKVSKTNYINIGIQIARNQADISSSIWRAYCW